MSIEEHAEAVSGEQWVEDYESENPDEVVAELQIPQDVYSRLSRIEARLDALTLGVNTIGEMMNSVQQGFEEVMTRVNSSGGIAGLLGGLMGGAKNG